MAFTSLNRDGSVLNAQFGTNSITNSVDRITKTDKWVLKSRYLAKQTLKALDSNRNTKYNRILPFQSTRSHKVRSLKTFALALACWRALRNLKYYFVLCQTRGWQRKNEGHWTLDDQYLSTKILVCCHWVTYLFLIL